ADLADPARTELWLARLGEEATNASLEPEEVGWLRWLAAYVRGDAPAGEMKTDPCPVAGTWRAVYGACEALTSPDPLPGHLLHVHPGQENTPLGLLCRLACLAEGERCLAEGRQREAVELAERAGADGDLLRARALPGSVNARYAAYRAGRLAARCAMLGLRFAEARWKARRKAWLELAEGRCLLSLSESVRDEPRQITLPFCEGCW
ncbi:MAG: hypothetical protein QHJ73_10610, partial [Armatimonadota bacterium]|nr:hypothetical protein [Armatimonadota bacterium]